MYLSIYRLNIRVDNYTSPIAYNFVLPNSANPNYDIVWSFQYSLCGPSTSSGIFTTFLVDAYTPMLTGGGIGKSACYGSSSNHQINSITTVLSGLSGAVLAVAFDSTGLFATSGDGFTTGYPVYFQPRNIIGVRTNYNLLSVFPVSAFDETVNLHLSTNTFTTVRCCLTNLAQKLYVDVFNSSTEEYTNVIDCDLPLTITDNTKYKIGFSFTTPVSFNSSKCLLQLKDIHYQGINRSPDYISL